MKKRDFDDKLKNLNRKITLNKSKHLLVENELKSLQTFDLSLFIGQSCFFTEYNFFKYFNGFTIL